VVEQNYLHILLGEHPAGVFPQQDISVINSAQVAKSHESNYLGRWQYAVSKITLSKHWIN